MKKKFKISFITNTVEVFAEDEHQAIDKAIIYQLYNNLSIDIIKVKNTTHISDGGFVNC
jgi:hypothetical protein